MPTIRTMFLVVLSALVALAVLVPLGFWLAAWQRESETADAIAPREGRFLATAQGRIFIEEAGAADGATVLLVHGMGAWSGLWRDTLVHLAGRGLHAVAIDLPPFGFSDRDPQKHYSRPAQARRIRDIVDALGAKRLYIVAHSIGAAPVVEALAHRSDGIAGLVLVAPALGLAPDVPAPPSTIVRAANGVLATTALRDPLVATTLTNPLLTKPLFSRLVARKEAIGDDVVTILQRPMHRAGSTHAFGLWLRELAMPSEDALSTNAAAYAAIKVPAYLIWGDRDDVTPLDQAHRAEALLKGSTLVVLPDLGHVPQVEDPTAFLPALDAGLVKIGALRD